MASPISPVKAAKPKRTIEPSCGVAAPVNPLEIGSAQVGVRAWALLMSAAPASP